MKGINTRQGNGTQGFSLLPFGKAVDAVRRFRRMSRFRSLWQASVNATKKALTWELEEMVPAAEKCIFKFRSKEDLKRWHLYSDSEYGGLSLASLEIKDGGNGSGCTG
ncbi:probable complex I intermediate-associated protein 30 [Raphanus sativus]|uniref:Probable complex I intermediate-associated protein 30 n=1 Tax=Raphanus sativus TaxID=3726 RepID=A0A6J0M4B4_RAPSA|nr:probable complex I intermediate-associated protein 30 [Raphanus sativus]